ncbi:hypothetical protein GCM10023200_55910 [Actinomycetospora chlora]|uniref:Uncharacterized protein n=1 Tax=Actinomycetospora chlora TaxID=663608 RepID=A0ABP9CHY8_9PSEU
MSAAGTGLSAAKVSAQAFAAVTTAAFGSFLGGAGGTVAGAGIAAVVTTVGDAVYQRSIERTRDHVRTRLRSARRDGAARPHPEDAAAEGPRDVATVVARASGEGTTVMTGPPGSGPDEHPTVVLGTAGGEPTRVTPAAETRALGADDPTRAVGPGTRVMSPPDDGTDEATALHGAPGDPDDPDDPADGEPRPTPWRRYGVLAATALLIFLVAMLAITGIERVKGSPLSGGETGTSVGAVFGTAAPTTTTSSDGPATTSSAPAGGDEATTTTEAPDGGGETTEPTRTTTTTSRAPLVPSGVLPGN